MRFETAEIFPSMEVPGWQTEESEFDPQKSKIVGIANSRARDAKSSLSLGLAS